MDLINTLVNFFKKSPEETKDETPEGLCSVCWGYNEYDGKIRKIYKDKQIDVNNHKDSYMLIQDFVVTQIDGIRLKKGELLSCPTCEIIQKETPIKKNNN